METPDPAPVRVILPRRPGDCAALRTLDTSYTSDLRWRLERDGTAFRWVETRLPRPFHKVFPLELDPPEPPTLDLCAWIGGRLAGYAEAVREAWNRRLRLEHFYVEPTWRGQGVGRALLAEVLSRAAHLDVRGVWVECQDVNPAALRFYLAQGFEVCGWDESLYDPAGAAAGETALFLFHPLADAEAARLPDQAGGTGP